ncbi:S8 family peptidase [Calidithermus roseus]|uniref:Aqualysin-1 n=1 Tax=Calidithermus roseus TaxID=1644118 RepID=A0A399ENM6_9DEIN|nr:S8 family peptidase [Calidithermus roseus]RIH83751.1 Aqualysin-1 [Calidithermus roseus]
MRRFTLLVAALLVLAACTSSPQVAEDTGVPVLGLDNPQVIPGQYIVVYKKDAGVLPALQSLKTGLSAGTVQSQALQGLGLEGAQVRQAYTAALQGVAVRLSDEQLSRLRQDPRVAYIEADQVMEAWATQSPATWGLDRIDQRDLPLSNSYTYNYTGAGVHAYIIDTGIRQTHAEFSGRIGNGYDAVTPGGSASDCNGHGTHVAGTVGGSTYGVAKAVRLHPVRVLDCNGSGSNSGVIAGVDWVAQNHVKPAVANMSLGGGASTALDNAVSNAINAGVTFAIAAGNSNANACNYSPARVGSAITVGSSTSSDARSSFSNYGSCLDLFAPGSSITSAWYTSDIATNTISGTSMATPHVAGVAALYLQANPSANPSTVASAIVGGATSGRLSSIGSGSPNLLLYSLLDGSSPPPPSGETYTGTLSGTGQSNYHPGTAGFSYSGGTLKGTLTGPSNADFDLYLQQRSSSGSWTTVARSENYTSNESITYSASAGTYRWRVYSYSGSGSYTLTVQK